MSWKDQSRLQPLSLAQLCRGLVACPQGYTAPRWHISDTKMVGGAWFPSCSIKVPGRYLIPFRFHKNAREVSDSILIPCHEPSTGVSLSTSPLGLADPFVGLEQISSLPVRGWVECRRLKTPPWTLWFSWFISIMEIKMIFNIVILYKHTAELQPPYLLSRTGYIKVSWKGTVTVTMNIWKMDGINNIGDVVQKVLEAFKSWNGLHSQGWVSRF